ncbi:ATP/GTP-binding protein [Tsukamurella pulmonis]|uniref:Citrate lyase beta subunit n=1 Tax=Tsukamurella pulmonis TaxID=47312 RepID=A0A1H1ALJ3_9ACTN|nr:HpcH/HpaI aldolase/citrate lyase family protein [Tsukamurella pulmonis]KXO96037.1 ATP/GTP-binding protein [Tsukamurella pulmonis]SDQ40530.1 Citrate lyase beta subunit [Tsukamurella pulmonis]SUP26449.1 Citrate lyase beta subunit [Tsukamurella pulmonis]
MSGALHHFDQLPDEVRTRLFHRSPRPFDRGSPREVLAHALGATLYVPANRPDLAGVIRRRRDDGVLSMVIDLEDAVADDAVAAAVGAATTALAELAAAAEPLPLLFIRPRRTTETGALLDALGDGASALTGVVLPKFTADAGAVALDALADRAPSHALYAMPVLETPEIVYRESRDAQLAGISELLRAHRDRVLAVRIGATDMSALFGIRRDRDLTIYDVHVVAETISAIVNRLGRSDGTGFVVTGPVWEYFADHERMFRPLLRATPFERNHAARFREQLVGRDLDGLLRETALDRANGLHGKTVIHPSHVAAVHALSAVTHEEYEDALDVMGGDAGGVEASRYRNKMNEMKPHRNWARQTLIRADVFGVTRAEVGFVDLLTALVEGR